MKLSQTSLLAPLLLFLFLLTPINSMARVPDRLLSIKGGSYLWTIITHPAEAISHQVKDKNTCAEEQHITPQSHGGKTVAYWAKSNHSVSDRVRNKPFLIKHDNAILSLATFTNDQSQDSLNAAYRMGAYGLPYTVFIHNYNRDGSSLLCTNLDAPSIVLYGFTWLINMPQKLVNQVAYIIDVDSEPNLFYLIDVVVAVVVAVVDCCIGVFFTVVGFFVAFLFNPIDSLCSILGMIYFIVPAVWTAISELVLGVLRLLPFI